MKNPSTTPRITKSALTLGSAVAIAGLVAAVPAHAATSSNPCAGGKTSKTATHQKKMSQSKANPCAGK